MRSVCIAVLGVVLGGTLYAQEPQFPRQALARRRASNRRGAQPADRRRPAGRRRVGGRRARREEAAEPGLHAEFGGDPPLAAGPPPVLRQPGTGLRRPAGTRTGRTPAAAHGTGAAWRRTSRRPPRATPPPTALRSPPRVHAGGPREGGRRSGARHAGGDRQGAGAEPRAIRAGRAVRRRAAPSPGGALPVRRRRVCGGTRAEERPQRPPCAAQPQAARPAVRHGR